MGFLNFIQKKLSPKQRVAAVVDAVIDRVNDRYRLDGNAWLEGDRLKFSIRLVDVQPNAPKVDLDQVAQGD